MKYLRKGKILGINYRRQSQKERRENESTKVNAGHSLFTVSALYSCMCCSVRLIVDFCHWKSQTSGARDERLKRYPSPIHFSFAHI